MKQKKYCKQEQILLNSANLRCTPARLAILKVLRGAKKPLSYQQIASALLKKNINKVTIYRTLERFTKTGIVHKAYTHNKAWHFELPRNCSPKKCHPHFTCKNCGRTVCLTNLSTLMVKGLRKGFVIHRQQVRLVGLCPTCA